MSLLSRLFGRGDGGAAPAKAAVPPEEHKGFLIYVAPQKEGAVWRVAARIEKDGRSHQMIRADTIPVEDEARAVTLAKARQTIDQLGERIFD